jgi:hypothetical protein
MTVDQIWEKAKNVIAVIVAAGIAYTPLATFIASKVPRPPATSPRWKRCLYDLLVDMPAWCAAVGRIGIFGGKGNVPLLPSRQPNDNPPKAKLKGGQS